ncbi:NADPH-dependent F420 reductase [Actinoplanes sp. KI2]|uniref:NADPH-dependent F420 reductase n=1 Tax=Actinoplanes sp. KI2 TaxID=2983315 RepID=UPI0021D5D710|nr:NADPH-dependent F420 reductase [Actinoplanes sp. KI2]MCU7725154.1 NADPH-dependent F420 reductase [Actinoplanes sp. KI2]
MHIGIIGAGHVGSTLARSFVTAGHDVAVANSRAPETLHDLETTLGRHAHAMTAQEAAAYGDMVVLAVPFGHYRELPAAELAGKTIIDAENYLPERDGHIAALDDDWTTSSELVQEFLPGARVVKAFNAMRWDHLRDYGHEAGSLERYGIPISGDDAAAKREVCDIIEQMGYEPVNAGSLAQGGRKHQPGSDVYAADLTADDLRARIGVVPG